VVAEPGKVGEPAVGAEPGAAFEDDGLDVVAAEITEDLAVELRGVGGGVGEAVVVPDQGPGGGPAGEAVEDGPVREDEEAAGARAEQGEEVFQVFGRDLSADLHRESVPPGPSGRGVHRFRRLDEGGLAPQEAVEACGLDRAVKAGARREGVLDAPAEGDLEAAAGEEEGGRGGEGEDGGPQGR